MKGSRRAFLGALAALSFSRRARAEDGGAPPPPRTPVTGEALRALLAEIARARKPVRTLTSRFTQERVLSLFSTRVRSTGRVVMVGPERLRWELAPPDEVVYWITPDGIAYRTPKSSAALPATGQSAKVALALADLRAMIGGDLGALGARYDLAASRSAAEVSVTGAARDKAARVRAFEIVTAPDLVRPLRAKIFEGKSDVTEITFLDARVDDKVDPALVRPR